MLDNWMCKEGVYSQTPGNTQITTATALSSMIWFRIAAGTGYLAYTDGRALSYTTLAGSVTAVNATEFATITGTARRWPVDRFRGYLLFGSHHDGLHWFKPEGVGSGPTYSGKAGLTAPSGTPVLGTGAGTGLTGVYKGVFTYVDLHGNESNPSPAGTSASLTNDSIDWSNITTGPTGTVSRKLYRTVANGGIYLYVATIANNTATTYSDSLIDAGLGSEVEIDNDAPPANIAGMCVAGSRLYLLDGADRLTIWACKIDPDTSLPNWEAYPSALSSKIPIGETADGVQNIFNINETLFAATRNRLFKLMGDPYTGQPIYKVLDVGFFNPWSWCYVGKAIYFLSSTFHVYRFDGENLEDVSENISGILNAITNTVTPDTTSDSVDMCYNQSQNYVVMNYAASGADNNKTLVYDIPTKQWSNNDWAYRQTCMDDTGLYQIGYMKGVNIVYLTQALYYKTGTTYFTQQTFTTTPFFFPDGPTYVGRIGLTCRARPVVNYMPPMLKVEHNIDNDSDVWKQTNVDLSWDFLKWSNAAGGDSRDLITVYVPVFKTVGSITIRVTVPQNAAAVQGFEIYDLFLEAEQRVRGRSEDRDPRSDRVQLDWK